MHLLPRLVLVVALVAVAAYAAPPKKQCNQPQPTCPSSSKKSSYLPDPCNCETYYECTKKGELKAQTCLPWENFDPKTLKCISWYLVDCSAATAPPATQEPATDSPSGATSEPSSDDTDVDADAPAGTDAPAAPTVVPGCSFSPACPATGSANLGIPCPDSCGKYIACKDGSYKVEKCGFLFPKFDVVSGECKRFNVKCAA